MWKFILLFLSVLTFSCSNSEQNTIITTNILPDSPYKVNPIKNGETFPNLSLQSVSGDLVKLDSLISQKPTIFIYFRGGWCYYCNLHFDQIHSVEDSLINIGYQLVTISSDLPEKMTPGMKQHADKLLMLSDSESKLAEKLGIAYSLDESVYQDYIDLGIELENTQGNNLHLLPVPGVFIVDKKGIVNFNYVNPDYKVRLHPHVLLSAAKEYLNYSIDLAKKH